MGAVVSKEIGPRVPEPEAHLATLRSAIDRLDGAAAAVFVKRGRLARRVALWKLLHGVHRNDPSREAQVKRNYARHLRPHGWTDDALNAWHETLMTVSARLQTDLTVAYQGGPGSWSDTSLRHHLPGVRPLGCETVGDAWDLVRRSVAVAAWLPTKNNTVGEITEALPVKDQAESWLKVSFPVRHALVAPEGVSPDAVERIEGHPRAFAQCAGSLMKRWPNAEQVATVDGAYSANCDVLPQTAVLGPASLAARAGWHVLDGDLCDRNDNATTFELFLPREVL